MRNFAHISSQAADPDDSSVLLSNTNKLLSAVGISTKTILSTEELTRVASSMFVAVFESLFHTRIEEVVRNPQTKIDYETNAQLVVDSLSDQIQMDLKHITGQSIVNGDVRVLSNLIHILVRIVSITSHDNLSSICTSEDSGERDILGNYRNLFKRRHSITSASISTRDSIFQDNNEHFALEERGHNSSSTSDNKVLTSSVLKIEQLKNRNEKFRSAAQRKEKSLSLRESQSRMANLKHSETSRKALQKRWMDNYNSHEKSFKLRQENEENVMLRKIYQGLLLKMAQCKIEEDREAKEKVLAAKTHTSWQIESLNGLFEERVRRMHAVTMSGNKKHGQDIKEENLRTSELLQSITARNDAVLKSMKNRLDQKKEREILRRRESHENMLALMSLTSSDRMQIYDTNAKVSSGRTKRSHSKARSATRQRGL